ncbi:hypothetical protein MHYP_G00302370 [Metynnis hypsauchen]
MDDRRLLVITGGLQAVQRDRNPPAGTQTPCTELPGVQARPRDPSLMISPVTVTETVMSIAIFWDSSNPPHPDQTGPNRALHSKKKKKRLVVQFEWTEWCRSAIRASVNWAVTLATEAVGLNPAGEKFVFGLKQDQRCPRQANTDHHANSGGKI